MNILTSVLEKWCQATGQWSVKSETLLDRLFYLCPYENSDYRNTTSRAVIFTLPFSGCRDAKRPRFHFGLFHVRTLFTAYPCSWLQDPSAPSSMVEFTGSEGSYVLITTADNQQKLVPVAQIVSVMQQQQQQQQPDQSQEDSVLS